MAISLFFTELLPIFLYKHLNFCIFLTIDFSQNLFCLFRHFYTFAHKPLLYDVCCDSFFPCAYLTEPRNITKMPYDPGISPGHTALNFFSSIIDLFYRITNDHLCWKNNQCLCVLRLSLQHFYKHINCHLSFFLDILAHCSECRPYQ